MVGRHPEEGEGVPFKGSMMIYTGESVEDVRENLMKDIYASSGVWDLEKAQIIPVCRRMIERWVANRCSSSRPFVNHCLRIRAALVAWVEQDGCLAV